MTEKLGILKILRLNLKFMIKHDAATENLNRFLNKRDHFITIQNASERSILVLKFILLNY